MRARVLPAWLAAVLALGLAAAGCGAGSGPSKPAAHAPAYPSFVSTEKGSLVVTCGALTGFPVSVLATGVQGVLTQDEVTLIFATLLAKPEYADELSRSFLKQGAARTPWRLLRDDGDAYTFGLGSWSAQGPGPGATVMYVHHHADGWAWGGGGECTLQPLLDEGNAWVRLSLPPDGLDIRSRTPEIGVSESGCTGGRDPEPFLREPFVVETEDAVTVYWTSTPLEGAGTCVVAEPVDVPLTLEEPIGDRRLLDGSTYPPTQIGATVLG